MKLCKDCKHCIPFTLSSGGFEWNLARCKKAITRTNLVSGEIEYSFCEIQREDDILKHAGPRCGVDAVNFEPKETLTH